jgi:L-ascorbate metabolism protein UlaG (beta-lactamase superfamily)
MRIERGFEMADIMEKIHWLGHSSFAVYGSRTVCLDPYRISGSRKADLILVSHTHADHFSPEDIAKVAGEKTTLVISADASPDYPAHVITMRPGDKIELMGLVVEAIPAYNLSKPYHPRTNDWLGFILTIDGIRLYHAGDTDFIPEMRGLVADVGLIPIGGTYTMEHDEAAEAVKAMKLTRAVPMHWGGIVGTEKDASAFKELVGQASDVIIMKKEA